MQATTNTLTITDYEMRQQGKEIIYSSVRQASIAVGISDNAIRKECTNLWKTDGGFSWRYVD
jgi:hypothetical protein